MISGAATPPLIWHWLGGLTWARALIHRRRWAPLRPAHPGPASDLLPGPVPGEKFREPAGYPSSEGWHRASPGLFVLLGFLAGALGPAATVPEVPGFPAPWRLWAPLRIPLKREWRRQPGGPGASAGATWLWGLKEKACLALNARRPAFFLLRKRRNRAAVYSPARLCWHSPALPQVQA